ncbi:3'-5' exonuclease [Metabacillus arenae]|uniref:3'-5' exoribonuclease n=1 Tax=Metabacillus arenae TaxID=2771434 RepID=A0A926NJN7_9BACI|nr:3'-5' exonuclease [Metabacillus arenae]MBD1379086.1 3'-5' exoribonuclease [Metabacillus arenae]
MRIDVMTDIETLGTNSDSTIIQISAIAFNINTGEYISEFNKIADIALNKTNNITGGTLIWWLNTNKELLTELLNEGEGSSEELLQSFNEWLLELSLDGEIHLWGNGILFDNKMIQHQLESIGLRYPIHYKNDRDVRTIVDLASAKLGITEKELKDRYIDDSLVHHNAFDDVKYQINLVVGCYNELIKLNKR